MEINNLLLYTATIFSAIAIVVIAFFIIPLQLKEAQVKNGLAKLRVQLLLYGVALVAIDSIMLYFLYRISAQVYFNSQVMPQMTTSVLLFVFSSLHLSLAVIGYMIYHQQYTPEQKQFHAQIDKIEVKAEKKKQEVLDEAIVKGKLDNRRKKE